MAKKRTNFKRHINNKALLLQPLRFMPYPESMYSKNYLRQLKHRLKKRYGNKPTEN